MNVSIFRLLAVATLLLSPFGLRRAVADDFHYIGFSDRISSDSQLTYLDLALQFAPGLGRVPMDGSDLAKLRHVESTGELATVTKPELGSIERVDFRLDGRPLLLVLFDLGNADEAIERVSVLALYDMAGKPKLLDAMDVGLDRESSFMEQPYLQLSSKFGMAFVRNSHHNAGEEYLQTSLIGIWDSKLHEVDTLSSYSSMAGNADTRVSPSFAPVKDAIAVDATFSIQTTRCGGDCEPDKDYPSTTERLTGRYSWDAVKARFIRPEHAFDKVPQANMEQ